MKEDCIRYSIRLTRQQDEQLKALAEKNGLTMSSMIRYLILQEINKTR